MTAERTRSTCGASLAGRRPDARYCSPACRRTAARRREPRRGPLTADPTDNQYENTARRAHASYEALRRLEARLHELARHLHSADGRLMAGVLRDALREEGKG